ncbi:MAG: SIMPL domain-containing protein [Chloroflexota bacterium]
MLTKIAILAAGLALAAGAAACSSSDDNTSTTTPVVQSQHGISVAYALQAGQRAQERAAGDSSSSNGTGSLAPGVDSQKSGSNSASTLGYSLSNDGLTVAGYGLASASADSAILELYFSTNNVYPASTPTSGSSSSGSAPRDSATTPASTGITEADLQPVIDAIAGAGIDRGDITFVGGSYYDPYYASGTLRVTVKDIGKLGDVMKAASDSSAGLTDAYLQGNYVSYTISDCAALEASAMSEAVKDADARSLALATAVSVTRGAIRGATSDSYSPFGGTACSGGYVGPYPVGGVTYAEGQASQVQVYATVSVTYAIQ